MYWFRLFFVVLPILSGLFVSLPVAKAVESNDYIIETVRSGDTLSSIAKRYGTSWKQVKQLNGQPPSQLVPGQSVIVPGHRLLVRSGDTAWEIALRHGLQLSQLKKVNPHQNLTSLQTGTFLNIPQPLRRKIDTGLFFDPSGSSSKDRQTMSKYRGLISNVGLFHVPVNPNGSLNVRSFGTTTHLIRKQGYQLYPVVTNLTKKGFDSERMHQILSQSSKSDVLVDSIWHFLKANQFQGVMLDIEGLKPKDRWYFNRFLRQLNVKLHPSGMKIAISIPPKLGHQVPDYSMAYDYPIIGKNADQVFIMAYDWHLPKYTGPGPIAPYAQVKATMKYASSVIPTKKLYLGIPMYAYEWESKTTHGKAYSQADALKKGIDHGSVIHFDLKSRSPWFQYQENGQTYTVWFEDARSLSSKFQLVRSMNWAGMGGWKMNLSFPQGERLLRRQFTIEK